MIKSRCLQLLCLKLHIVAQIENVFFKNRPFHLQHTVILLYYDRKVATDKHAVLRFSYF